MIYVSRSWKPIASLADQPELLCAGLRSSVAMKPGPDADDVGATELWCKELWYFCQTPLNASGLLGTYSSTFSKTCNQSEEIKLSFRASEPSCSYDLDDGLQRQRQRTGHESQDSTRPGSVLAKSVDL